MIEIIDIHKSFGEQVVLNGVNLKIEKGEVCALIGGSGKGKSILLKHIMGLMQPDKGKILIDGKNIFTLRGRKLNRLKDRMGIMFQGGALFDSYTVYENLAFPLKEKTKLNSFQIEQEVKKELELVGLEGALTKYPAQISGGMRKRVALARCLVMDPEIILFDEPTTGLDPLTVQSIHNIIKNLKKDRILTALIVSHEIPEIFEVVDKVAMLHEGKIAVVGTPEEIVKSDNPTVKEFIKQKLNEVLTYCEMHNNIKEGLNEKK